MYKKLWEQLHQSICQISFFDSNNIRINSLTGFKINDYIVTDEMVLQVNRAYEVEINFVALDSYTSVKKLRIPISDFRKRIISRPKSAYNRLVLIKSDIPVLSEIPGLKLFSGEVEIGNPVAVLGFQCNQSNLCIKSGILSSICFLHGSPYLQFEVSVKQGNSGAPVVDAETGEVIGVVGYRLAELTKSYNKIKDVVDENVEILETALGKWKIEDIDPIQVLIANQKLIKHFAKEIYQSADVRIGFAVPASEILNYIQKSNSKTKFKVTLGNF